MYNAKHRRNATLIYEDIISFDYVVIKGKQQICPL